MSRVNSTQLKKDYLNDMKIFDIAKKHKCSVATIYYYARKFDLVGKRKNENAIGRKPVKLLQHLKWIKNYEKKNKIPPTAKELAVTFNLAYQTAKGVMFRLTQLDYLKHGNFKFPIMVTTTRYWRVK